MHRRQRPRPDYRGDPELLWMAPAGSVGLAQDECAGRADVVDGFAVDTVSRQKPAVRQPKFVAGGQVREQEGP